MNTPLLLTYDPNVKQTPDYIESLKSPYGNKTDAQYRFEILSTLLYAFAQFLPRAKTQ